MVEVRCRGCGRLLGKYDGKGQVKCPKTECGGINIFDTNTGEHEFIQRRKHTQMKDRKTSSGVTFW